MQTAGKPSYRESERMVARLFKSEGFAAFAPICSSGSLKLSVQSSLFEPPERLPSLAEPTCSVYVRVPFSNNRMQLGAEMVHLGRQELDVWLGEPDDFVLAVLRDIYADETEVKLWLNTPHQELGGRAAVDLLSAGRVSEVESILVEHWNGR